MDVGDHLRLLGDCRERQRRQQQPLRLEDVDDVRPIRGRPVGPNWSNNATNRGFAAGGERADAMAMELPNLRPEPTRTIRVNWPLLQLNHVARHH